MRAFAESRFSDRSHSGHDSNAPRSHFTQDSNCSRRPANMNREPAYPITDLKISEGAYREIVITKISNPNSFYVRITEFEEEYKELRASLSKEKYDYDIRLFKGMAVAVKISGKNHRFSWSRGILHDVQSKRVELVDMGGSRSFNQNCLRRLNPEHLSLPKLAIKCSLTDNEPYTEATLNRFRDDFIDCRFLAHFKKKIATNYYLIVLLHYETITSFDMLKVFIDKPVNTVKSRVVDTSDNVFEAKLLSLPSDSEDTFYIRLTNEENRSTKLYSELHDYYHHLKGDRLEVSDFQTGNFYVCEYKGKWFRARFNSNSAEQGDGYNFFLIDEGFSVDVNRSRVRQLLDYFASMPAQAIRCSFDENGNWPSDVEKKKYTKFSMKFIGTNCDTHTITTIKPSKDVANKLLIQKIESLVSSVPSTGFILTPNDIMSTEVTEAMSDNLTSMHDESTINNVPITGSLDVNQKSNINGLENSINAMSVESKTIIEMVPASDESDEIPLVNIGDDSIIELIDLSDNSSPLAVIDVKNVDSSPMVESLDFTEPYSKTLSEIMFIEQSDEKESEQIENSVHDSPVEKYVVRLVDEILDTVCNSNM